MKKTVQWVFLAVLLAWFMPANSQQTAEKFVLETQYLLYLPTSYTQDTSQVWPLVIFLHGSGESGTDLQKVKAHGPPKLVEQGKNFPFIIVSPQATNGWKADQLMAMINDIKKKYKVDKDRVYLTGLSMGGFGTWNLAMEYPNEFAAIAPICGGGSTAKSWALRHMPIWCFHGAKDNAVPLSASQQMVDAVKVYNPSVKFTIYPEAFHDSWTVTYDNDSLYSWLLSKKRYRHIEKTPVKGEAERYSGEYLTPDKDTIVLLAKNDSLFIKAIPGRQSTVFLKPSGSGDYFFDAAVLDEVKFVKDKKNKPTGFIYYGRERQEFIKLPANGARKPNNTNTN